MNPWADTSLEQRCLYSEYYVKICQDLSRFVNMCQQDHESHSLPLQTSRGCWLPSVLIDG